MSKLRVHRTPIYIVGLPPSGRTWIGSIVNSVLEVKYFYEPCAPSRSPNGKLHWLKYLLGGDTDSEFAHYVAVFVAVVAIQFCLNGNKNPTLER